MIIKYIFKPHGIDISLSIVNFTNHFISEFRLCKLGIY